MSDQFDMDAYLRQANPEAYAAYDQEMAAARQKHASAQEHGGTEAHKVVLHDKSAGEKKIHLAEAKDAAASIGHIRLSEASRGDNQTPCQVGSNTVCDGGISIR